jgi:hypothetical protein
MQTFQGKVAVVTGAPSPIGPASAEGCAQEGMNERYAARTMKRGTAMSTVGDSGAIEFSLASQVRRLLPSFIYSAVIPIAIYLLATHLLHLGNDPALLLAAVSPLTGTIIDFLRQRQHRQLSPLGVFGFAGLAVSGATALLFHSPRLLVVSGSTMDGVVGVLMLGSVVTGQPLIVAFALHGVTSAEARVRMKEHLMAPALHHHLQVLTVMWGLGLLLILVAAVALTFALPLTEVAVIRPIMDPLVIIGLLFCTAGYRWYAMRRQAERRGHGEKTGA